MAAWDYLSFSRNRFLRILILGAADRQIAHGEQRSGRRPNFGCNQRGDDHLHGTVPLLVMGAGFFACALLSDPRLAVLSLALVPIGHCSAYGPFFSMPTRFLTGASAAAGIALVVTIANVGGFIGPTLMGAMKDRMGTHSAAFMLLGACGVVAALLALRLRQVAALGNSESAVSAEQQSPAP